MPEDFEVPAGSSRALRRAILAAHLTGAAGAVLLCGVFAGSDRAWLAAGCTPALLALLAFSLRRSATGTQAGRLQVCAAGAARWQANGADPEAFEPLRWSVLGGLAWIEGRAGGRRVRIMSGRREIGDRSWRLLLAWLRWMDRGGAPAAPLGIPAESPKLRSNYR